MARAQTTAARTSTRGASRSDTTTASGAKRKKNEGVEEWSAVDGQEAAAQGWGVFLCVDQDSKKTFLDIQLHGKRFNTNNDARDFVGRRAMVDKDPLAVRAATAVFKSKIGPRAKMKGK